MQISLPPRTSGNHLDRAGGGNKISRLFNNPSSVVIVPPFLLFCLYVHESMEMWVWLAAALPFDLVCGKMQKTKQKKQNDNI